MDVYNKGKQDMMRFLVGKAIDMQALAKLILYCLTYHKQYDNLPIRNEDGVFRHKWADLKNENGVAYDLIRSRLQDSNKLDYTKVYFQDMSDYLLYLQKQYPFCSFTSVIKNLQVGSGWMSVIDDDWKEDMMQGPKSSVYLEDTLGLLQLIRNTSHHIRELPHFRDRDRRWFEKHVSSTFPSLFMDVYNKGKEYNCGDDGILSRYYSWMSTTKERKTGYDEIFGRSYPGYDEIWKTLSDSNN
nr:hypothetical protein [Tanacetum cinerariifolium]